MFEFLPESDCENGSETLNSGQSSMSSESCSSLGRLSFDALEVPPKTSSQSPKLKPHRSSDSAWKAIRLASSGLKDGLNYRDFKLVRRIGSGDLGHVYLCRLRSSCSGEGSCFFAMKVVDREALALKKKIDRSETEKRILKMLDHPFLPTLYAQFDASHYSCVVMEYCCGGDLHTLRHRQPGKCFSLNSARFYAAEVLVALEYLHMLGIVYRDLKPENVLVRSDGHIMLTDFDLSLCSDAIPAVEFHDPCPDPTSVSELPSSSSSSSLRKVSLLGCFRSFNFRPRKVRTVATTRQFVAEPVTARSCSFVGTHEYVSPEVAAGKSHGNAVDWWALGIFIYELIYGRTPFSGGNNEITLRNIVKQPVHFPTGSPSSGSEMYARDLIARLLVKDPAQRLGSKRGASEVKTHPFFKGVNFALIRSSTPPAIPDSRQSRPTSSSESCRFTTKSKTMTTAFDFF